jgi:hypothetical protein
VVVLAQSLVLFVFSSSSLSSLFVKIGLPKIPMVPVSSSQVIVGCILGIGLYKGARNINFRILGEIAIGWIATPIAAGLLSFFSLFFIKNIFSINVGTKRIAGLSPSDQISFAVTSGTDVSIIIKYVLLGLLIFGTVGIIYFLLLERKKKISLQKSEERFWMNIK